MPSCSQRRAGWRVCCSEWLGRRSRCRRGGASGSGPLPPPGRRGPSYGWATNRGPAGGAESARSPARRSASGGARRPWRRDQILLEEGAEVAAGAGGAGDVGAADRVGVAASRIASSRVRSKPSRAGSRRSPRPGPALPLGALAGGRDRPEVDPVAADVEVFGVLVDAGHLRPAGTRSRPSRRAASSRGDAGDRVVVAEGQRRHPGGRRLLDHPAGGSCPSETSNATAARSARAQPSCQDSGDVPPLP